MKRAATSAASTMQPWKGNLILDACGGLPAELVRHRAEHVSVLLELGAMSGSQMNLSATLHVLAKFAERIVSPHGSLIYFWKESEERSLLRAHPGVDPCQREKMLNGNILDFWARQHGKAMLIHPGGDRESDAVLATLGTASGLVIPLSANSRAMGSLQLFHREREAFNEEDAQLLWMLARIGENLLTREYSMEGLINFAFTDHLTALKTRGFFEQQLELEVKRCERKGAKLVLLMLDIDHFKLLNDRYGHPVGDRVLRQIAAVLSEDMREIDTVARYGGEEFVIILPETTADEGRAVADRIRAAVERTPFPTREGDEPERLSVSIGNAVFGEDTRSKRDLVRMADAALYYAKSKGRNRVMAYADMPEQLRREVS
jgi:diguanylate cyclase (GGDEF)-like protein